MNVRGVEVGTQQVHTINHYGQVSTIVLKWHIKLVVPIQDCYIS